VHTTHTHTSTHVYRHPHTYTHTHKHTTCESCPQHIVPIAGAAIAIAIAMLFSTRGRCCRHSPGRVHNQNSCDHSQNCSHNHGHLQPSSWWLVGIPAYLWTT